MLPVFIGTSTGNTAERKRICRRASLGDNKTHRQLLFMFINAKAAYYYQWNSSGSN
ncbi:hypothetical protein PGT21_009496 [Puccinia graminis f. sp. tritici]|uniref:Uncharacterized protein n=1 Tax=Puccinia graminis f. sp. tritici TaxID=56615 RepID=A0A5B0MEH5_PUCGR|nr:hypothetical protein PGT21_009496 [Puccinia graminis f. sp. tritici]